MFWAWLAATLVFDLAGMALGKKYILSQEPVFLLGAIVSFAILGYTMTRMLEFQVMAIANIIWAVAAAVLLILIGWAFFAEKMSWLQLAGIILCVVGVILIQWPSK